jgi:aerobic-type carbon monoxide dehydrogenase small subunit (CoxS/CutS family)
MTLTIHVDGAVHELPAEAGERSLLRALRDDLGLLGPKNACEQGECGSCTWR